MIAVKNLQCVNDLLGQEELLQAVALHYTDMVSEKKATALLHTIIKTSKQNHKELLDYLQGDLGKTPLAGKVL